MNQLSYLDRSRACGSACLPDSTHTKLRFPQLAPSRTQRQTPLPLPTRFLDHAPHGRVAPPVRRVKPHQPPTHLCAHMASTLPPCHHQVISTSERFQSNQSPPDDPREAHFQHAVKSARLVRRVSPPQPQAADMAPTRR
jgi:hypothetical protein